MSMPDRQNSEIADKSANESITESILVVEDSPDFQRMIKASLAKHYRVTLARSLAEARKRLEQGHFDLLVLDVNLPDGEGFQFCEEVRAREATRQIPVIFLTGRSDLEDKLKAFALGGDDYIVKPFELLELKARVEARLARVRSMREALAKKAQDEKSATDASGIYSKGMLQFDLPTLRAYVLDGTKRAELGLTPIEFKILYHLTRNEAQVVSREQLLATIWGEEIHVFERATDKHVSSLRQKLGPYAAYIETVSGVGYRFVVKAIDT